jgi:hypothetical protein
MGPSHKIIITIIIIIIILLLLLVNKKFYFKEILIVKPVREKAKSWIKSFQIFFATRFYYTEVNKAERTDDVVLLEYL